VVSVSVYKDVQRYKRFEKEKSAAARDLGLARGTVRKFWNMDEREYDAYRKQALTRRHRFDVYREEIITIVELNAGDGETVHGSSIYDVLEERHGVLPGSERTLRNYIRTNPERYNAIPTSIVPAFCQKITRGRLTIMSRKLAAFSPIRAVLRVHAARRSAICWTVYGSSGTSITFLPRPTDERNARINANCAMRRKKTPTRTRLLTGHFVQLFPG